MIPGLGFSSIILPKKSVSVKKLLGSTQKILSMENIQLEDFQAMQHKNTLAVN